MTKLPTPTLKEAMEIVKRLQAICKRQRREIKALKLRATTGRASPQFNFNDIFNDK